MKRESKQDKIPLIEHPLIPGVGEVENTAINYLFAVVDELVQTVAATPPTFSPALVLGYAGVLQLARLEAAGIDLRLKADLPSVREALKLVNATCTVDQPKVRDKVVNEFIELVIDHASDFFSLKGRTILGADIVVADRGIALDLDVLANVLWETRLKGG